MECQVKRRKDRCQDSYLAPLGAAAPRSLQNAHATARSSESSVDTNRKRKQSREVASFATVCDYSSSKPAIQSEDGVARQAQSASKIQQK